MVNGKAMDVLPRKVQSVFHERSNNIQDFLDQCEYEMSNPSIEQPTPLHQLSEKPDDSLDLS